MSNAFAQKMAGLEDEIYALAGRKFNVGSPAQVGEILFDEMGLEGGKKGKTGKYATGADVLEDLATLHEMPARVLDWRQLSKLKSTYTDALQDHINADTGRVHTSYSIAGASTGRFGIDIHALTASEMFGVPLDEMTPDVRRQAKAINFGVIYGISGFGLARNLRIPRAEAQGFIDRYFERFPGIRTYMDDTKAFAKEHGYVQTLFGRKIHTPNIATKGPQAGFAARAAINAPIQGTAADVIRRAMIRMPDAIKDLPATMLLQVHDELLFEVEAGAEEALIEAAREVMENANDPVVKLDVKLTVDAGQGSNWAEAH